MGKLFALVEVFSRYTGTVKDPQWSSVWFVDINMLLSLISELMLQCGYIFRFEVWGTQIYSAQYSSHVWIIFSSRNFLRVLRGVLCHLQSTRFERQKVSNPLMCCAGGISISRCSTCQSFLDICWTQFTSLYKSSFLIPDSWSLPYVSEREYQFQRVPNFCHFLIAIELNWRHSSNPVVTWYLSCVAQLGYEFRGPPNFHDFLIAPSDNGTIR